MKSLREGSGNGYRMRIGVLGWLVLGMSFLWSMELVGQVEVRGRTLDALTGLPVRDVNIVVSGSASGGWVSDSSGYFGFQLRSDQVKLAFTHIGYQPVEVSGDTLSGTDLLVLLVPGASGFPEGITLTASRIPVSLGIIAPVVQVPAALLYRDQDLGIAPVMNRIPGIFMHSGGLNTNRITIRGIGSRSPFATAKIKAYLNDIPLTSGVGETTLEDVDVSLIRDLQIWKGPSASTYGAGLGGVLLFGLDSGSADTTSALSHKFTTGAFGLQRHQSSLRVADRQTGLRLHLNFNQTALDGYRDNSAYDRGGLALAAHWGWADSDLTVFLNNIGLKAFIPSSLNGQDFMENPQRAAFIWASVKGFEDYDKRTTGINYRKYWLIHSRHRLRLSTSVFSGTYSAYESRPFNILRENSRVYGLRNTLTWEQLDVPGFLVRGGLELFEEDYNWQTNRTLGGVMDVLLSDDSERRGYYNAFMEAEQNIGFWKFSAGLNLNRTHYRLRDRFPADGDQGGNYTFEPIWSPRLGIKYRLRENVGLFGVISHGFSAPTLEETLNPAGQVNPEIQPERGWNTELGLRGIRWRNNWSFDVSVFSMQIRDLLVAERTNFDQFIGKNAGRTLHNGLELFVQYHVPLRTHQLDLGVGYTYADYRFRDFTDRGTDYGGNRLPGVAPHVANVLLDWFSPKGIFAHVSYQWVDAMPLRDDNLAFSERYDLLHVKVGWAFRITRGLLAELSGGLQNVLDEHYASMILVNAAGAAPRYYYPGNPINGFGSVQLRWNW